MADCLQELRYISADVAKASFSSGSSILLRFCYARPDTVDLLTPGSVLSDEVFADVLFSAGCFAAEQAAVRLLSRCEQCESRLRIKLQKKGFPLPEIDTALRYLKTGGLLSDERFARSWLRNRAISHTEGRSRLLLELMSRGITRAVAADAVTEFFSDIDEEELLLKAILKCKKNGKSDEAVLRSLLRRGFAFSRIRQALAMHV